MLLRPLFDISPITLEKGIFLMIDSLHWHSLWLITAEQTNMYHCLQLRILETIVILHFQQLILWKILFQPRYSKKRIDQLLGEIWLPSKPGVFYNSQSDTFRVTTTCLHLDVLVCMRFDVLIWSHILKQWNKSKVAQIFHLHGKSEVCNYDFKVGTLLKDWNYA